ncbi:MAG TPA: HDOD domain-containing protein [Vicinamibacterales bacterium]|nr:HDOD domain-containing protein [Vicinamibacterales bacterium]
MLTLKSRLADCDTSLPMLPDLATRVIEMTADPDTSAAQLVRIVSKDQVLASRLLALANSAYCAPMREISTVTEAVVRIGTTAVRNLVVTISFYSRMYDQKLYGQNGRRLVDHSIGTAYLARLVADRAATSEDEAFLSGLLHDIGKLVILKLAHDHERQTGVRMDPRELEDVLVEAHAEIGARMLHRWNLPTTLEEPILYHHDYRQATRYPRETAVVYLANVLSHRYGFGCEPHVADPLADPVCGELGIDEAWMQDTDLHAPGLYEVARQVLA